jgi:hypothetical protein
MEKVRKICPYIHIYCEIHNDFLEEVVFGFNLRFFFDFLEK